MMISHDKALDLAADRLDFGIAEDEAISLGEHLAGCYDCERYAAMMAADDAMLETSITWEDADPYSGAEPDAWMRPDEDDDDDDQDEDRAQRGVPGPRSDEEDDESEFDASDRDDDLPVDLPDERDDDGDEDEEDDFSKRETGATPLDDEDDEPDVTPIKSDVDEIGGDEPETDEQDVDAPTVNDGVTNPAGDGKPADEPADINTTHESEDQDIAAAIKAEIEALTDEELGGVDEDGDNVMPDCAADGVEQAAKENGAPTGDHVHQRAERAVHDDEGVSRTAYGNVAVYRSTKGIRTSGRYGNGTPEASAVAAAQIRNAVLRSRTGRTGVERFQKRGRLDGKSLHRIASKDDRLFKRNTRADPGKFFIRVAVDVSGSMSGSPVRDAAAVARALADATVGTPTIRLEIWAWSDPFTANHQRYYGRGKNVGTYCSAGVVKVWGRGMPTSEVFRLAELPMGGTPDAPVLDWMWRDMTKESRSDETPVVIMCSDGWGDSSLPKVIEQARDHGVRVKNVALGNYVHELDQIARFGHGNYVPWAGSMEATARPLADMILRLVTGADR